MVSSLFSSGDESIPSLLASFGRRYLLDSTSIPIPENLADSFKGSGGKAKASGMKLQLMLDYQSGNYVNVAPADGIQADSSYIMEAIKLVDEMGGKVVSIYALLGGYDLVLTVELPGNDEAMKLSLGLSLLTGISFSTFPAVSVADFDKIMNQ